MKLLLVLAFLPLIHCQILTQPEQVHLSYGGRQTLAKYAFNFIICFLANPSEMIVTWVTFTQTMTSSVEFGINLGGLNRRAEGSQTVFIDGGDEKRTLYIHRVTMKGLNPGQRYCK